MCIRDSYYTYPAKIGMHFLQEINASHRTYNDWKLMKNISTAKVYGQGLKKLQYKALQENEVLSQHFPQNYQTHVLCVDTCLLYTSPSPRDGLLSRMPSSA
eukprot:TRINITY_DN14052_c0_g2_i1.p1 TRINITY_DN14052_c0_g2~~TRINITY_DN14052_c0_g2_i1.p1  ORF type:complete len:101 (-),score=6.04 TRINITY_DN14052_c0_g2_i1:11-313(-)